MKSTKKGLIVLIVILVIAFLSGIISKNSESEDISDNNMESFVGNDSSNIFNFTFGNGRNRRHKIGKKITSDYVAILHIEGVIQKKGYTYNQEWLLETIETLKNDSKNKGIMLFIDSPGGTVYESDEAYLALIDYKNETERPIYAYFGALAASGGYYIASAADYIIANRNTLTGSIGVIAGQSVDATGLMEKLGIKSKTFHAGRNKTMMNYDEPLSKEQEEIMQSIADDAYEQFTSIVATARKMSVEDVKKIADGRIYTANQALKNGLIDEIGLLENAKDSMIEIEKLEKCEFTDFTFEYQETFKDIFRSISSFIKNPTASSSMNISYIAY